MKKLVIILFCLLIGVVTLNAAQLKPFPFLFNGRWQPSENPLLIEEGGFQDIQNMRKDGNRLKGVSGHTKINTTALSTYQYARNGYHFRKEQPSESHVLVFGADAATQTAAKVWQNTTAIPTAGDFSATAVFTDAANTGLGRFASWPQGNLGYADGEQSMIWGGNEYPITLFITATAAVTASTITNPRDYTEQLTNTLQTSDQIANVGSGGGVDGDVKLMLHCDGADSGTTFTDSSAGAKAMTAVADAVTDVDRKYFGTAGGLFDGTGDAVTTPDHADFDLSTVDFTLDLWVYITEARFHGLFSQITDVDAGHEDCYLFGINNANKPFFQVLVDGVNTAVTSSTGISLNTWTHLAFVRSSGTVKIYIMGTSYASGAVGDVADQTSTLRVGYSEYGGYYLAGSIDELRWSLGKARWTADFTPQASPYNTSASHWLIGASRPLQGVKFYIANPNTEDSTLSAKFWDGSDWTTLTITDNTSGLDTTGTVTWADTDGTAKPLYMHGLSLYWYQFTMTAGEADIYYVTANADFQTVKNIWDGSEIACIQAKLYEDSTYKEYTDEVSAIDTYTMLLDALVAGTEYLLLGFTEPIQGIRVVFAPGKENVDATVLTVSYWNGTAWVSVSNLTDGTDEPAGDSFGKSGYITWSPIASGEEFEKSFSDEIPFFFYKLHWSVALDAEVEVDYISGIPNPPAIKPYKFPGTFQGRAFLFAEVNGSKNKAIYSAANSPDIWNGSDSGALYFGDESELTAAATIYNVFQTTGYYQLLVTKKNETYRVFGDGPANWEVQQMSGTVGCIAPLTMVVCDISEISKDSRRHVAIWQTQTGIVMSDGATITPISEDIKCYWDPTDARYIPTTRQDDSVAWYDPNLKAYKILISSGSGQTFHNVELEYSLLNNEWTKLLREDADKIQGTGDYTEVDGKAVVAKTDTDTVTVTGLDNDDTAYLYRSFGTGYFDGDFEFHIKINVSARSGADANCFVWALSNSVGAMGAIDTAGGDYIGVYFEAAYATYTIRAEECNSGALTTALSTATLSIATDYYLKIVRSVGTGAFGTVYCYIYSDREMRTLVDTVTLTLSEDLDWRYLYWMASNAAGAGGSSWSGTIENLEFITGNENPLQVAFPVQDTNGIVYTYGLNNGGQMYRLENGTTWDGYGIEEFVWTKDLLIDQVAPFFLRTTVDYLRLAFKNKATAPTEDIEIWHYCNGTRTATGVNEQNVPDDIDIDQSDGYHTASCTLGPCFKHSFKFLMDESTIANGMELTGLGLMYETEGTIAQ